LEEYGPNNVVTQKYLQGYHGLVKTLQNNVYYYQDEVGSTSHIANASGALIESYQYDLYGKPRVYNSGGIYQPAAVPAAKDLFTGQRWINELALYDDRNRFMSPALGRFIQPDPIGFKGDASSLYRYCGNDWANRTDPMGTDGAEKTSTNTVWQQEQREIFNDHERGAIMSQLINVQRIYFRDAVKDMEGFSMGKTNFVGEQSAARSGSQQGENISRAFNAPLGHPDANLPDAARDPAVRTAMNQAWEDSNPYAPNVPYGQPGSQKMEQGGWVRTTDHGREVTRVPHGTRDHLPTIYGTRPSGAELWFHTHPNNLGEGYYPSKASAGDIAFTRDEAKVPGIIIFGPDHFMPIPYP
jgi:RHS repeat-associated protein